MKNLTEDQKQTVWTRLSVLLGLSEKSEVKLADYTTKEGATISVDDTTGEVQGEVADGEYPLEDGSTLVIAAGKLESVTPAATDAPAPDAADEAIAKQDEVSDAADETADASEIADLQKQLDELKAAVEKLTSTNTALQAENEAQATKLAALDAAPADKKVTLSAHAPKALTPAQLAWERYKK